MEGDEWRGLRAADRQALSLARSQAHDAAQFLARAARAYVEPQPDDGHTSLGWAPAHRGFATKTFGQGGRLAIGLAPLRLVYEPASGPRAVLPLGGADGIDVRRWLGARLAADGFDPERLDAAPPYAMPESAIAQGGRYGGELAEAGQGPLADWFAFAERQLDGARAAFAALSLEAPAPRLWPHHFDLATLVAFAAARGETGYVGAGFSPGDGYYDEPYFYVSIYPKRDLATLPALSSPGVWHSKDFLAAVAPAHRVLAPKDVPKDVAAYLREAIKAAVAALRP